MRGVRRKGITVGPDGNITGTTSNYPPGNGQLGSATFRLLGDAPVTGQLVVTQQPPASLTAGTPFGLTVEAEDSSGNIESSFNGTVTVALASNPGGRDAWRHTHGDSERWRGHILRTDTHHGRLGLHARGHQQRPQRGRHELHHRDAAHLPPRWESRSSRREA